MEQFLYFNYKLIEEGVREVFLHFCDNSVDIEQEVKELFPNLIVNFMDNHSKSCCNQSHYKNFIVSKRIIYPDEYDTNEKLGKLLGYKSAEGFDKLNRDLIMYNYTFYAVYDNNHIDLFNELSQDKLDLSIMLNEIKKVLLNDNKYKVTDVYLEEDKKIPVVSLINQLKQEIKISELTELYTNLLLNCLWNESLYDIYNKTLLKNKDYKMLMIEFLNKFRYNEKKLKRFSQEETKEIRDKYNKLL